MNSNNQIAATENKYMTILRPDMVLEGWNGIEDLNDALTRIAKEHITKENIDMWWKGDYNGNEGEESENVQAFREALQHYYSVDFQIWESPLVKVDEPKRLAEWADSHMFQELIGESLPESTKIEEGKALIYEFDETNHLIHIDHESGDSFHFAKRKDDALQLATVKLYEACVTTPTLYDIHIVFGNNPLRHPNAKNLTAQQVYDWLQDPENIDREDCDLRDIITYAGTKELANRDEIF